MAKKDYSEDLLIQAPTADFLEHFGKPYCYNSGAAAVAPWRGVAKEDHPSFGRPKTPEEAAAISATLKAYYAQDITNHPRFGKQHTEETKARISASKRANPTAYWEGKTWDSETREKIGAAQRGEPKGPRVMTEEGRAKIRASIVAGRYASFKGRKHTEETKLLMSKRVFCLTDNLMFDSLTATLKHYGLKMPTLHRALKSGQPIQKGRLAGYVFKYAGLSEAQINKLLDAPAPA